MTDATEGVAPADADRPPANLPGQNGESDTDDKDKFRGMRKQVDAANAETTGLRKELDEYKAKAKEADDARLAEQGKWQELAEQRGSLLDELQGKYDTLQKGVERRLRDIAKENKTSMETLPEEFQALVPPGLDPDATAAQIKRVRSLIESEPTVQIHGGAPRGGQNLSPEDQGEQRHNDLFAKMQKRAKQ